jgi:phosphoserine aminotransferase
MSIATEAAAPHSTSGNERVFNFSPGPAVLPLSVLEQIQVEMLCLPGAGASILEISHRSKHFSTILAETKSLLAELLGIPANYRVLFLQGGSRLQFSMIPMNLLRGSKTPAEYIVTGSWGKYALKEAQREGAVNVTWDGKATNYDRLPSASELAATPGDAAYVHYTSNETIQGVQFAASPPGSEGQSSAPPMICDASSDFMCRPVPVDKFGLIYACAQKNAGPAGVTVLILREDLLEKGDESLPGYLNYRSHASEDSLYNTPPTFGIYVVGLICRWLRDEVGGLAAMEKLNAKKSALLYAAIDDSNGFYRGHAQPNCRSLMNVTFRLPSEELEKKFVQEAERRGLTELKGHRSVGGIRASVYNAMPERGASLLAEFMNEFRKL